MKRAIFSITMNEDKITNIKINKKTYGKYIYGYELKQIAMEKPVLTLYVKYYLDIQPNDSLEINQVLYRPTESK